MLKGCRKCRRAGEKLFLKGERCLSPKCAVIKRSYAPGERGQFVRSKLSEYGRQLREKQKAKQIYNIDETQFAGYYRKADKMAGNTALNLMRLLEMRLDNAIYRLGLASSRAFARQLVAHGHFKVNDRRVTIPSRQLKIDDLIVPQKPSEFKDTKMVGISWISVEKDKAKIAKLPERDEIDTSINESLIIEFYSR